MRSGTAPPKPVGHRACRAAQMPSAETRHQPQTACLGTLGTETASPALLLEQPAQVSHHCPHARPPGPGAAAQDKLEDPASDPPTDDGQRLVARLSAQGCAVSPPSRLTKEARPWGSRTAASHPNPHSGPPAPSPLSPVLVKPVSTDPGHGRRSYYRSPLLLGFPHIKVLLVQVLGTQAQGWQGHPPSVAGPAAGPPQDGKRAPAAHRGRLPASISPPSRR